MLGYKMADVFRGASTVASILTDSQDKMAEEKGKFLSLEAKREVDFKKNKLTFYGLTKERYYEYLEEIRKAAKETYTNEEMADIWGELCCYIFDDYMLDTVFEYEDALISANKEAALQAQKKVAFRLEKKSAAKKESMNRKAARKSKLNERRW